MATIASPENKSIPAVDPRTQYVSSWVTTAVSELLNALPKYVDDIERDFGTDTYEKMLRDSAAGGAVDTLRDLAMDAGLTISPSIDPPKRGEKNPEYDRAVEIADFVREATSDMDASLEDAVYEMLLAIAFGSQVAEIVLKDVKSKLHLRKLAVRPRANIQPVVDQEMNLVGYYCKKVGRNWMTSTTVVDAKDVVPRNKFAVLTFKPRCDDPRGTPGIRRAYNAWYIKTGVWPAFFRFLLGFGSPSLAGFTPEDSPNEIEALDPTTGETKTTTPEQAMQEAIAAFFANGSVVALKGGSELQVIQSTSNGEAYQLGIDILDREITRGILLQTRATMEALHGSKADSEGAKDILDVVVRRIQNWGGAMIERDVFRLLVKLNFGDDAVNYTPKAKLSGVNRPDFSKTASGIASLFTAGYLADEQLPETDEMLGLPPRDMDKWEADRAAAEDLKRQQAADVSRLMNPTADGDAPAGNTPPKGAPDKVKGSEPPKG